MYCIIDASFEARVPNVYVMDLDNTHLVPMNPLDDDASVHRRLDVELHELGYHEGAEVFLAEYQGKRSVEDVLALVKSAIEEGFPLEDVIAVFRQRCEE